MANKDGDNQITWLRSGMVPAAVGHRPVIHTLRLCPDVRSLKILRPPEIGGWGALLQARTAVRRMNGWMNEYMNGQMDE